ncbi:MAG: hypothetical protein K9K86_03900, partial [Pseudomonadales bacterium]|nr:hypothetical protein [Pseudomonadales bacterium]
MRSPQLSKHYLPVILVLFVGGFLSFFAQNYISTEARKQKLAAFNALASTSTAKLQDEKRRHIVALNTLSAAISGYSQILTQLQFERLSAQMISDIPALKRLTVVTPAGASAHNATKVRLTPDTETNYKIIYSYPKKAVENTTTINQLVRNYRALSLSNGPNTPEQTIGFLVG